MNNTFNEKEVLKNQEFWKFLVLLYYWCFVHHDSSFYAFAANNRTSSHLWYSINAIVQKIWDMNNQILSQYEIMAHNEQSKSIPLSELYISALGLGQLFRWLWVWSRNWMWVLKCKGQISWFRPCVGQYFLFDTACVEFYGCEAFVKRCFTHRRTKKID